MEGADGMGGIALGRTLRMMLGSTVRSASHLRWDQD
jgi:hypothetical protein